MSNHPIALFFIILIDILLIVSIIGISFDLTEDYSYYKDRKKEIPTVPYKSFEQFFIFEPDKYRSNKSVGYIEYKTFATFEDTKWTYEKWNKITIDTFLGFLKADKLIKKYQQNQLTIKLNNQKDRLTKEYLAEITKNIEETHKKIDDTFEKEKELCIKRINTLS